LLADVAQHPLLPESELARLKNDAVRQVTIARSIPQQIANERFRKILYPDHPYGRVLPARRHSETGHRECQGFYQGNFVGRGRIFTLQDALTAQQSRRRSPKVSRAGQKARRPRTAAKGAAKRVLDVTDRPGAAQSTIFVGLPVPPANSRTILRCGDEYFARWIVWVAHHLEHSRAEGLHILAEQPSLAALARCILGGTADVTTAVTGPSLKEIFARWSACRKKRQAPRNCKVSRVTFLASS